MCRRSPVRSAGDDLGVEIHRRQHRLADRRAVQVETHPDPGGELVRLARLHLGHVHGLVPGEQRQVDRPAGPALQLLQLWTYLGRQVQPVHHPAGQREHPGAGE